MTSLRTIAIVLSLLVHMPIGYAVGGKAGSWSGFKTDYALPDPCGKRITANAPIVLFSSVNVPS